MKPEKKLTKEEKAQIGTTAAGAATVGGAARYEKNRTLKHNPKSKNIAIVYPGGKVGQGHAQPTEALKSYYEGKGYNVDTIDVQKYHSGPIKKLIADSYGPNVASNPVAEMNTGTMADPGMTRSKTIPEAIRKGGKEKTLGNSGVFRYLWNKVPGHTKAVKELSGKEYSKFITMHGTTTDVLKNRGVPVDTVLTDTVQDPFVWQSPATTKYHVPTMDAKSRYMAAGVDPKDVNVTGSLVVNEKYKNPEALKVPKDFKAAKAAKKRIITIAGGGEGIQVDSIAKIVADKYKDRDDIEIHAITAKNSDSKRKPPKVDWKEGIDEPYSAEGHLKAYKKKNNIKNLKIYGFVDDLGERMKHSDVVVTRPGGSTTGELLHLGTPTITYNHGDVAKSWQQVGNHEHGNVKTLSDAGFSRHFQTKHNNPKGAKVNSDIINPKDLHDLLDDVDNNYDSLAQKGRESSAKFIKMRPEDDILKSVGHAIPKKKLLRTTKALGATGAALLVGNAAYAANKKKKSLEKGAELKEKLQRGAQIGAIGTGAAWTVGHLAKKKIPGLARGKGAIVGPLEAVKNLGVAAGRSLRPGKHGGFDTIFSKAVGVEGNKLHRVKLTPSEIVSRSSARYKGEVGSKEFKAMDKLKIRQESKKYDMDTVRDMLKEQETYARKNNYDQMVGVTHLNPLATARAGFAARPDLIGKKGIDFIFDKNKPRAGVNYYKTERTKAMKKLRNTGYKDVTADDAYFLADPVKNLNLFTKDLRITPQENTQKALGIMKKHKNDLRFNAGREKEFNKSYNEIIEESLKS